MTEKPTGFARQGLGIILRGPSGVFDVEKLKKNYQIGASRGDLDICF